MPELIDLKQKVLAGEEVTAEEYKLVVDNLRQSRTAGAQKKQGVPADLPTDLNDLFK